MCKHCDGFRVNIEISSPSQLSEVVDRALSAISDGSLGIVAGDLCYEDFIDCELQCRSCGSRFKLVCETYHGSGGSWSVFED